MVRFLVETEQSYVESLKVILKVNLHLFLCPYAHGKVTLKVNGLKGRFNAHCASLKVCIYYREEGLNTVEPLKSGLP